MPYSFVTWRFVLLSDCHLPRVTGYYLPPPLSWCVSCLYCPASFLYSAFCPARLASSSLCSYFYWHVFAVPLLHAVSVRTPTFLPFNSAFTLLRFLIGLAFVCLWCLFMRCLLYAHFLMPPGEQDFSLGLIHPSAADAFRLRLCWQCSHGLSCRCAAFSVAEGFSSMLRFHGFLFVLPLHLRIGPYSA